MTSFRSHLLRPWELEGAVSPKFLGQSIQLETTMPHFSESGQEQWVCQKGGHICTGESTWVKEGTPLAKQLGCYGNVCGRCLPKPKSINETTVTPIIPVTATVRVPEGENRSDFPVKSAAAPIVPQTIVTTSPNTQPSTATSASVATTKPTNVNVKTVSSMGAVAGAKTVLTAGKSVLSGLGGIKKPAPHVVVIARAGTGKTTTLIEGLKLLKGGTPSITPSPQQQLIWDALLESKHRCRYVCFAAFNKSIADELESRMPPGCEAKTLHRMGFAAIRQHFGRDVKIDVNEHRTKEIIEEITGTPRKVWFEDFPRFIPCVEELVSLCKVNLLEGTAADLYQLCDRYDIEFGDRYDSDESSFRKAEQLQEKVFEIVPQVLAKAKLVSKESNKIDFDDQIWLPIVNNYRVWRNDLLVVDEGQDMNRCQQELAKRAGDRLIIIGDDRQAIYAFAGADSESLPRLTKELTATQRGCKVLPLTVTRRCGRAIVQQANKYVQDFEAHESNPDGKVMIRSFPIPPNSKLKPPAHPCYLEHVQPGDMIICRSNAPLVSQCFKILKMNMPAYIMGKADIAQSIVSLITKMDATTVPELITKLEDWCKHETEKEKAKKDPNENKIERFADRRDCALCFCEDMTSVHAVIKRVESLFMVKQDAVRLSSIHKAKGLEAKRVFVLAPGGFRGRHPRMQEWEWQTELNLRYVGDTRAIEELIHVF